MKKSTKKTARREKRTLHIAVIVSRVLPDSDLTLISSRRSRGDWASFVGFDLPKVVEQARVAMDGWSDGPGAPYEMLVGTIDWRASFPVEFTLKPLAAR